MQNYNARLLGRFRYYDYNMGRFKMHLVFII